MTTSRLGLVNRRLAVRLERVNRIERDNLANFAQSIAMALPLALLGTEGAPFVLGVAYAVAYALLLIVPTRLYVLMAFDALRILFRRRAVFLPHLLAISPIAPHSGARESPLALVLSLGVTANPLASLTRELWLLAYRFNAEAMKELRGVATQIAENLHGQSGMAARLVAIETSVVPGRAADALVTC